MSLLDEIASLGDEAFVAWEKYSGEHSLDFDALGIPPASVEEKEPYLNSLKGSEFAAEDENLIFDAVYMYGRFMAAFVSGPNIWIGRKPERNDGGYGLFVDCRNALYAQSK